MPDTTYEKIKDLRQQLSSLYKFYIPTKEQMATINEIHLEFKKLINDVDATRAVLIKDYLEKEINILRTWHLKKTK